jgi:type II secretion system protein H
MAAGFTLLELIIVLVIVCTALALAAPSLRGFWTGSQTKDTVHHLLALARWARSQAAADGRVFRLYLNRQEGTFWLAAEDGGAFAPLGSDFGRIHSVPAASTLELTTLGGTGQEFIDFYPDGWATPAQIRIVDPHGEMIQIASRSPTERFEVVDGTEASSRWR